MNDVITENRVLVYIVKALFRMGNLFTAVLSPTQSPIHPTLQNL